MAITPVQMPAIERYYQVGITEVLFCLSIANKAAPVFAELDAGTDLTRDIMDMPGWSTSTNFLDTPDIKTRFTGKLPGRVTSADSALVMYADRNQSDARTFLARDTVGFIVIAWGGLAVGIGDVFHVHVSAVEKGLKTDAADTIRIPVAVLDEPAEDVTLPQT